MSDSEVMPSQPEMSVPAMPMEAQVEIIWQMGLASLASNNNELVLPQSMATYLPQASVENLKFKLSRHIGAPTIAFLDQEAQLFRICRVPSLVPTGDSSGSFSSPQPSSNSRSSATPGPDTEPAIKSSSRGSKSAVPRPPNAFILYRKDRHPILKQADPSMHNNDISRKVGEEWKQQSGPVQAAYKARAERIKKQHAIDNPGYQYAPRKPGDKKRRMTKKKLARMRSGSSANDVADHVRSDADGDLPSDLGSQDDVPKRVKPATPPSAEDYMGTHRSPYVSQLVVNYDGNAQVTLPSNNPSIVTQAQGYQNLSGAFVPFNSANASTVVASIPQYVQNDDAFVNSIIDWEGIARDRSLVHNATAEELAELSELELGNSFLDLSAENARTAFQNELDRTMGFF